MTTHEIKRGVSLYSYQEEVFLGKLDLEGAIKASAEMGALGIEIIPEQSFDNFPHLTEEQLEAWHGYHVKYGTTPTAYDMFIDFKRRKDRLMTFEEGLESIKRDIVLANKLGATVMRVIVSTPPEVYEHAAGFAEDHNVRLAVEVHAPMRYDHRHIRQYLDIIERTGSKYLGLLPDMGTFVEKFPRVVSERSVRNGATPALVDYMVKVYNDHEGDIETLSREIAWRGGNAHDMALANTMTGYNYVEPKTLIPIVPHLFHIHAKFYEMVDDSHEYSIPYDEVVPLLIEHGYRGYLSSEYEGNRHIQDIEPVDSVEQVRRQQVMLARLLGEKEA